MTELFWTMVLLALGALVGQGLVAWREARRPRRRNFILRDSDARKVAAPGFNRKKVN